MKKISGITLCCLFTFLFVFTISAQTKDNFQLAKKTILGGEGGWDYLNVDSQSRRLYISHGNQVEVLNVDTHEKVGVITETMGVHGIVTVPELNKGFITNGKTNSITIFDIKTLKKTGELPAGNKPDALLYDSFSGNVFVFNNDGGSATIINAKTGKIVKTLDLGGAPEAGVSDEKGLIYVNLEDKNEIVSFGSKDFTVKKRFKLTDGDTPTGLAIDKENNILFSVCRNKLMFILEAKDGKIIEKLPIGTGVDGLVFDNKNKLAISSNGEGTLTVVKENSASDFKVLETVTTAPGARTITIDSKTNHVFVSTAQFGEKPATTTENPKPRSPVLPNTFMILEYGIK